MTIRSISQCTVKKMYLYDDSCQANTWLRCSICGGTEHTGCLLSEDTIAYRILADEHEKKEPAIRIKNAKQLVAELVLAEREKTQRTIDSEVDKRVNRNAFFQGAKNTMVSIFAIIGILHLLQAIVKAIR